MPGVLLISGPTGSGKTSLLATAAEWCWKKHKKVSRLYSGDLGGWTDKVENLMRLGIIESFKLKTRVGKGGEGLVEETLRLSSLGWWPAEIDTATGEVMPGVPMLPPVETVWRMICTGGHVVKEATQQKDLQPQLCPECKVMTSLQSCRTVESASTGAAHFKNVGLIMVEGLSSLGAWGMTALADRRAKNELAGEKSSIGGFRSGDIALDGNNRADYGFTQGEVYRWLQNAGTIVGLVRPPIWTALEDLTKNGDAWGPSIPGSAATSEIPQWVGDWLGTQTVLVEGKRFRRLYLSEYRGEDGKPHRYKARIVGGLPEWLEDEDDQRNPKFDQFSLGRYFDLSEAVAGERYAAARKEYPDAPGNLGKVVYKKVEAPAAPAPKSAPAAAPAPVPPPGVLPPGVKPPTPPSPTLKTAPAGSKLPPPRPPAPAPQVPKK